MKGIFQGKSHVAPKVVDILDGWMPTSVRGHELWSMGVYIKHLQSLEDAYVYTRMSQKKTLYLNFASAV